MVEAGLLLPLLVFMLLAVAFIGFGIYERQNVLIASRFAAREASMNAMAGGVNDKLMGVSVLKEAANGNERAAYAKKVLGSARTVDAAPPTWRYESVSPRKALKEPIALGSYAKAYVAKDPTGKFGIGFVMYGQRITSKAGWFESVGTGANEGARLVTGKTGKIWDGMGVRAEAYMPSELPVRMPVGAKVGLVDLNPWIKEILEEPLTP
ncbi:hypothetical protein D3C86_1070910 [compost metagenome]